MQTRWNDASHGDRQEEDVAREMERWSSGLRGGGLLRLARRIGIGVVGSAVLGVGVVMLVAPGPAFVVIPAGLGILALEFEWARRWLDRVKQYARNVMHKDRPEDQPAP